MFERDGGSGFRFAHADHDSEGNAGKGRDRHIERHVHAAQRAAHHDAFPVKLHVPHPLVGCGIGCRKARRQA